ncbi:MAG: pyridoxamine 5'-phosphate oxidase family protein, partial [Candidatus Saccharibacteria bacterium]
MSFTPTQTEVYDFLQDPSRQHGVLGYLDASGNPDAAFIGFSATPELGILFGTSDTSRKFSRIHDGAHVSFNVTDKDKRYTVQLKGLVRELSKDELALYEDRHYAKLGEVSRKYKDMPDQH